MDVESDEQTRAELRRLLPDGDLMAMAGDMRRMGLDSLLICRPDGRIAKVVSEHRVRRLAQPVPRVEPVAEIEHVAGIEPGEAFIPEQSAPSQPAAASSEGEGIRAQTG